MPDEKGAPNGAGSTETNVTETSGADDSTKDQAAEVNARLLDESKKYKKAYQDTRSKLEELEKSKLQEQQKYKELYEQTEQKYQGLYKSLVKEKIRSSVADKASKAGCLDVDALLKLGNAELLQLDEDTLDVHGADTFVEEAKKAKPYLFQAAKASNINATTPGGVVRTGTKTLKDLSKDEIMSQLRALGK